MHDLQIKFTALASNDYAALKRCHAKSRMCWKHYYTSNIMNVSFQVTLAERRWRERGGVVYMVILQD